MTIQWSASLEQEYHVLLKPVRFERYEDVLPISCRIWGSMAPESAASIGTNSH